MQPLTPEASSLAVLKINPATRLEIAHDIMCRCISTHLSFKFLDHLEVQSIFLDFGRYGFECTIQQESLQVYLTFASQAYARVWCLHMKYDMEEECWIPRYLEVLYPYSFEKSNKIDF